VLARQNATQLQLPASVYQAAVQSPEGFEASFDSDRFVNLSNQVYSIYLTLIAREVYFVRPQEPPPIAVQVKTVCKRLFLGETAAHLLAAAMLLLAVSATVIQIYHRGDRRRLRLKHEPGTIASAVSIGAQTGMGNLLAGMQRQKDMDEVLQDKKFRIDPTTMKIVMEGEVGYQYAHSPVTRRKSIFAALQGHGRSTLRPPATPPSPNIPA